MSVHVGIIDQDPVRLITPLLDNRSECVHMAFIGEERQKEIYLRLQSVLEFRGISSEFFEIPTAVNTSAIKQKVKELAETLKQRGDDVYFNASCGLRHRLLSVYEVIRSYNWPIFVVEPFSDNQCWLYPDDKPEQQVQDHIKISDYLTIFGARSEFPTNEIPAPLDAKLHQLGKRWASNALELGPGLATLNYLATTCRKEQKLDVELTEKQQGYRELDMLISDLVDIELATYQNGILTFYNEDARRFSNGEWLENLVHNTVREIQDELPTIQESFT